MNKYVNGGIDDDRRSDGLVRALYAALGERAGGTAWPDCDDRFGARS